MARFEPFLLVAGGCQPAGSLWHQRLDLERSGSQPPGWAGLMSTRRLHKRYGLAGSSSTTTATDAATALARTGGGEGAGGGDALALATHDERKEALPLPPKGEWRAQKQAGTREEVERLRERLARIDRRSTMTLEDLISVEMAETAAVRLRHMQRNTSGFLARKVEERQRREAEEALAERRRRQKSAGGVMQASAEGDVEQLRYLLQAEERAHALCVHQHRSLTAQLAPPAPSCLPPPC
jgi:hypothetical protein